MQPNCSARSQDADVKAKLIENTQSAVERGAFGSPTFFVGKEYSSARSSCAKSRKWSRGIATPHGEEPRVRGVSNPEAHKLHPSRRGEDAAPQDEEESKNMEKRNAAVAVIGAPAIYIGGEIAEEFAAEGFTVFAGRRDGAKLEPLVKEIEASGGTIVARTLDARKEDEVAAFLNDADKHAPLEVCIFNVGANVNFPILETTDRVFRKVWKWPAGPASWQDVNQRA